MTGILRTYEVTYWTGATEYVRARTLHGAYTTLGYTQDDGSHLWTDWEGYPRGTGIVTNEHADICATITYVCATP